MYVFSKGFTLLKSECRHSPPFEA